MRKIVALFFQIKYVFKWQWIFFLPKIAILITIVLIVEQSNVISKYYLYDGLMQIPQQQRDQVVILQVPQRELTKRQWTLVINQLQKELLANKIVFNFIPRQATHLQQLSPQKIFFIAEKTPATSNNDNIVVLPLPQAKNGIYREQKITGSMQKIIGYQPHTDTFFVNFHSTILTLELKQVIRRKLVAQIMAGKTILIAKANRTQLHVPFFGEAISLEQFRAHLINSLIQKSFLLPFPWKYYVLMLLVFALGYLFVYIFVMPRRFIYASILLFVFTNIVIAGAFYYRYFIPSSSFYILLMVIAAYIWYRKSIVTDRTLQQLFLRWSDYFKGYLIQDAATVYDWDQSLDFLAKALELDKYVFLKNTMNGPHLQLIKMVNCDLSDISEKRRDYNRFPYNKCFFLEKPLALEERLFFKQQEGKKQYLIAVRFLNRLLGFIACSVANERNTKVFELTLNSYAEYLGETIYQKEFADAKAKEFFEATFLGVTELRSNLEAFFKLFQSKFLRYANLIDRYSTPTILYTLVGRIFYINEQAKDLLQKEMISTNTTLSELIAKLGGYSPNQSNALLMKCILERQEVTIPIEFISDNLQLRIFPLTTDAQQQKLDGIVCEFVTKDTKKSPSDLVVLTKKMGNYARSELTKSLLSASLLREAVDSQHQPLVDMIEDKMLSINKMLEKCEQYVNLYQETEEMPTFPVDSIDLLNKALRKLDKKITEKHIKISIDKPSFPNYALGGLGLQRVFLILLLILIDDGQKNSVIDIKIEETKDNVVYHFHNEGIGMPNDLLQSYIMTSDQKTPRLYKDLKWCAQIINSWNGLIEGTSQVGLGINFTIEMHSF